MIGIVLLAACLALLQTPSDAGPFDWFGSSTCPGGKIHNYYFGHRTRYQRLLYVDRPNFDYKLFHVRTEELRYPMKGQPANEVIRYIEVLDQKKGTGGCVYIKNGGVGSTFVTLKLKSQRSRRMEFIIRIYGY